MAKDWAISIPGIEPLQILGQGGFGQVWLARQVDLDRLVAVKVGHRPLTTDDDRRRFERECKALGRLSGQPNIVEVYTSGLSNGLPYLVLEYIDGGILSEHGPRLAEPRLRLITDQLCRAVAAAHEIGILHRDLKPENVFIDRNGDAILGDFGIARLGDGNNTATGQITASVAFAPPEVLEGEPPSRAADVYGIGVTIVSAIVGNSPFVTDASTTLEAIISLVLRSDPPALTPRGISPAFEALLFRAMAKEPAQRPASALDMLAELHRLPEVADSVLTQVAFPPGSPGAVDTLLPPDQPFPQPTGRPAALPSTRTSGRSSKWLVRGAVGGLAVVGLSVGGWAMTQAPSSVQVAGVAATESPAPTNLDVPVEPVAATPLGIPLTGPEISQLSDIPVDFDGLDPLLGPADSAQFCEQKPDITGLVDTVAAVYPASPFDAFEQVAQRMHRFQTPEQASAFMTSYSSIPCPSWEENLTTDGELSTLQATVTPSTVSAGDEVVQIDLLTELPTGIEFSSRTVLVRQGTDVYKLFYSSIDKSEVEEVTTTLLEEAIANLGY